MEAFSGKKRVAYRAAGFIAGLAGVYGLLLSMDTLRQEHTERRENAQPQEGTSDLGEELAIALAGTTLFIASAFTAGKLERMAEEQAKLSSSPTAVS